LNIDFVGEPVPDHAMIVGFDHKLVCGGAPQRDAAMTTIRSLDSDFTLL